MKVIHKAEIVDNSKPPDDHDAVLDRCRLEPLEFADRWLVISMAQKDQQQSERIELDLRMLYTDQQTSSGRANVSPGKHTCPQCEELADRVNRRLRDRIVSIYKPLKRYHCHYCGWTGCIPALQK